MLKKLNYLLSLLIITIILSCSDNSTSSNENKTGTLTDIDGNTYKTVKIGEQWWMAENLEVKHYRNGNSISNMTDSTEWHDMRYESEKIGVYCAYGNDETNIETYGLLYSWGAVTDSQNIAPEGWHVPTYEDWQILIEYLGGRNVAGGKLKETGTFHWNSPNTDATNETGFAALPGGYRSSLDGTFRNIGNSGRWWSVCSQDGEDIHTNGLNHDNAALYGYGCEPRSGSLCTGLDGNSVRLVKD